MTGGPAGLPHSEICGSQDICSSPQLFAAYHVLLRLREPRHPPYALLYFLRRAREIFSDDLTCGIVYTGVILVRFFNSIYFRFNMSMISSSWRITDSNR